MRATIGNGLSLDVTAAPPSDAAAALAGNAVPSAVDVLTVERTTREAVRAALAAELHDDLGAQLTALRFALARIETFLPADAPRACSEALHTAERTLDDACSAMRRAVDGLRTTQLDASISAAMRRWTGEFGQRTGIAIDLRLSGCLDARLDRHMALDVLRLVQEACSNAARHGRAGELTIEVSAQREQLSVRVCDDGCGFAPRAGDCAAMRHRAKALGGSLSIASGPHGTEITLNAPLHAPAPLPSPVPSRTH